MIQNVLCIATNATRTHTLSLSLFSFSIYVVYDSKVIPNSKLIMYNRSYISSIVQFGV